MRKFLTWSYYRTKAYIRSYRIKKYGSARSYSNSLKSYVGNPILTSNDANKFIIQKINSGEPFLAARFGSTELLNMHTYDFGAKGKYNVDYRFKQLCDWSGFFPNDISLYEDFVSLMKHSCKDIDLIAVWFNPFEDYYIKNYMKDNIAQTYLLDFEPWADKIHWSSALEGKKVLIIHPFEDTIKEQYMKREKIFINSDILPKFKLETLKAVQTLSDNKDERFSNWFEALEYMYKEAMKKDFDIAIIGCGAYGLPLAAKLKASGKQAIHLAGATQLLFGIKGKRWESNKEFAYVQKWFNDSWVYPSKNENIVNGKKVEGGCYWK